MKKLIITCALLSATTLLSNAQSANSPQAANQQNANPASANSAAHIQPEQIAQRRATVFQKQLGLSNDQYNTVYKVELDYANQMQQMHTAGVKPTDGAMQQASMSREARLQNVMTPDQWSKYQAMNPHQGPAGVAPQGAQPGI